MDFKDFKRHIQKLESELIKGGTFKYLVQSFKIVQFWKRFDSTEENTKTWNMLSIVVQPWKCYLIIIFECQSLLPRPTMLKFFATLSNSQTGP